MHSFQTLTHKRFNQGFTMAELIIVIAILAVLIVYLVRNFGVRSDDAKIAMVTSILTKDVPSAFQAFILENNGCLDPFTNQANLDLIDGSVANGYAADQSTNGIRILLDNGVPAGTPWDNARDDGTITVGYNQPYTKWSATFVPSGGTDSPHLELTYPLNGVGNLARARSIITAKLQSSTDVHSVDGLTATGGLNRADVPTAASGAGQDVVVHYACS